MEAAIERLRISKEQFFQDEFERGKKRGRYWALERADYGELVQLAVLDVAYLDCLRYSKDETIKVISEIFETSDTGDHLDFVERIFGVDAPITAEFWVGWVDGAQEAFSEIKDQI